MNRTNHDESRERRGPATTLAERCANLTERCVELAKRLDLLESLAVELVETAKAAANTKRYREEYIELPASTEPFLQKVKTLTDAGVDEAKAFREVAREHPGLWDRYRQATYLG